LREDVVQQVVSLNNPVTLGNELATTTARLYTHVVRTDGSWRIGAGNKGKTPGLTLYDYDEDYDAVTSTYTLKVGQLATITIDGVSGKIKVDSKSNVEVSTLLGLKASCGPVTKVELSVDSAKVTASTVEATALLTAAVKAIGAVTIQSAASVSIDAPLVKITGNLQVAGTLRGGTPSVDLTSHVHANGNQGANTTAPIPS
jgi:hypothetical protein